MAVAYFPSLEQAEILEVAFLKPQGGEAAHRLLVDSGFTGQSCFVLPHAAVDLAQAAAPNSQATGALQGKQKRIVVTCRISALSFQKSVVAIVRTFRHWLSRPGFRDCQCFFFFPNFTPAFPP